MKNPVAALEQVLSREKELYEEIFTLETGKKDAILKRDGKTLERLSTEQEKRIAEVQRIEESRIGIIERYRAMERLDDLPREISLRDVVGSMDEDSSKRLMRIGVDLKDLLCRLRDLQDMNGTLLNDTMEFYRILLSGIRSGVSLDSGYSKDGREEGKVAAPVLFNQTA
ncbi:MAG: flagellar protein FlgN [Spirochaetes bacterium]|nr:flagellar protein FlgN [Spirochaetota bacterium]